jgi:hypothetical protein
MRIFGLAAALAVAVVLSGCAGGPQTGPDSTPEEAAAAAYRHDGPPAITLYTMINNRSGSGAHTSIMVNGSQRVIFDPAGSVRFAGVPEIGDVLYGVTPTVERFYESAHARETYHVRIQHIEVPAETAELALRLVQQNGSVAPAACTTATSAILGQLPGFGSIRRVVFPNKLADQFAGLPGVTERKLFEEDSDDKAIAIAEMEKRLSSRASSQ